MDIGTIIVSVVASVVALASAVFVLIKGRGENSNRAAEIRSQARVAEFGANLELNKYIDDRVDTLVTERLADIRGELSTLKNNETTRTRAMTRILRAIANQWPSATGPDLDPADIAAIEETIPTQWIRNGKQQ